jgi:hypothetical protein
MGHFSSTKLKKEMKSRVNVLSVTILHSIDTKGSNPISKRSTKSSSTVLNEISFKRGLLIFSNAGHNKRK